MGDTEREREREREREICIERERERDKKRYLYTYVNVYTHPFQNPKPMASDRSGLETEMQQTPPHPPLHSYFPI